MTTYETNKNGTHFVYLDAACDTHMHVTKTEHHTVILGLVHGVVEEEINQASFTVFTDLEHVRAIRDMLDVVLEKGGLTHENS